MRGVAVLLALTLSALGAAVLSGAWPDARATAGAANQPGSAPPPAQAAVTRDYMPYDPALMGPPAAVGRPPSAAAGLGIPVQAERAALRDVPITLAALGTAQASALVTVRAQVDGVLQDLRFREGQDVRAGDVLGTIDPRTYQAAVDQAVARKQQDQAALANAGHDLWRIQQLADDHFASSQQADTARATVAQLGAQVAQDQAMIENARALLSHTSVTAPVAGRLGIRQVDAGNVVHPTDGNGIVVITALQPIAVVFTLPQQRLAQVGAAMRAGALEVTALLQGAGDPSPQRGTLGVMDNQVDAATGTIKLKAMFPNAGLRLWPGAFVAVRLQVEVKRGATTVPAEAVQRGPHGRFVYVVTAAGTAQRRQVRTGHEDRDAVVIEDGLQPGELVVTEGAAGLADGAAVSVLPPAGGEPGAASTADASRQGKGT